ncbi:MAG: glycosyltransferase family 87 protein [Planctomycetota bacterium]
MLSLASFAWRGPYRAWGNSADFALYYCSSRALLAGRDPFLLKNLQAIAAETGAPTGLLDNAIAPPFTYLALAPFAAMDYPAAKVCWIAFNLLLAGLLLFLLAAWADLKVTIRNTQGALLVAMILGLAPLATCIAFGQLALVSVASLAGALCLQRKARPISAGLMLALAGLYKPQIAAVFVLYWLYQKRWKGLAAVGGVGMAMVALCVVKLEGVYPGWLLTWQENVRRCFHGGASDYARAGSAHILLNLQYPVYAWFHSRQVADVLPWIIALALLGLGFLAWRRVRDVGPQAEMLPLSLLALLGLLPLYHVYYDALLLALPICWAFASLAGPLRRYAMALLLLTTPFLVPGAAFLAYSGSRTLGPGIWSSWWMQNLLMPHQSYLLAAMSAVLVLAMVKLGRETRCPTPGAAGTQGTILLR